MPKQLGTTNVVTRTAAPGSPVGGQTYNDSATGKSYIYDAVAAKWRQLAGVGGVIQTGFAKVTSDVTTTSTSFVDVTGLSVTLTTTGGDLVAFFTFGASNSTTGRENDFRILLDGTSYQGTSMRCGAKDLAQSGGIVIRFTGVAAGSHTVKIQWQVSNGTGQIRPVTGAVDKEHANLLVQEVSN